MQDGAGSKMQNGESVKHAAIQYQRDKIPFCPNIIEWKNGKINGSSKERLKACAKADSGKEKARTKACASCKKEYKTAKASE